ncbi:MAG: hypothetical protein IKT33_01635 [Clostridia bacterium]|nr:hypothetical protein [Clostridia bacterium]
MNLEKFLKCYSGNLVVLDYSPVMKDENADCNILLETKYWDHINNRYDIPDEFSNYTVFHMLNDVLNDGSYFKVYVKNNE